MKTLATAIFLCVIATNTLLAADDTYTIFAEGTLSCATYVRAADRERAIGKAPDYYYDRQYVNFMNFASGFFTGANAVSLALGQVGKVGEGSSVEARMLWLENWCRAHPMENFVTAMSSLWADLAMKRR